jgi:glycosyltransferase involved in cell wall biosynthesis
MAISKMNNKSNTPLISVIVPIYKTEIYLKQCIDSILAQTLTDIEIILVDDGSPDNCPAICDEYAKKDKRVKVIHQKNGGYGKACNAGINAATGEYIGIVESDDYIEHDMYETLYSAVQDDHCPIVKGSFFREYQDGYRDICSLKHITNNQLQCKIKPEDSLKLMIHDTSIWAAIYRRDFIISNKIKMLETKGASYQDDVWKFETFAMAEHITLIDKPVYHYRYMREGSSVTSNEKFNAVFDNFSEIKKFLLSNNKYKQYKNSYYVHYLFSARFNFNRFDEKERKKFILQIRNVIKNATEENINIEKLADIPKEIIDFYYKIISTMSEKKRKSENVTIIAVVQVQNEADIIESLCRYYCSFCDGIIVTDDMSTDNTNEILQLLVKEGLPVYITDKNEIDHGWDNVNARSQQLHLAADRYNADIILPIDADEFLVNVNGGNPRQFLESLDETIEYHIPWRNYVYSKKINDNSKFYPSICGKYAEPSPPLSKAIISRYLLKEKKAFPATGCHSFFYPEEPPVIYDVKELSYNHYAFRSVYHFMLKVITCWTKRLTFPYHDGSTYFQEAFHHKELYEEIKKHGIISEEMLEKYSTYIFPVPKDTKYKLKESNFDISFCKNKLKMRYTNYNVNEKDFIKMLTTQLEKNLRDMPSWRTSMERKIAGEQLGQANVTIANLTGYIETLKQQSNQNDLLCTYSCIIFLDNGSGFVAEDYIIVPLNKRGNRFEIEINFKANVNGIRFDPYEGYACIISDLQIITSNGIVEYTYTNGISINNVIVFDTTDPQIAIDFDGKTVLQVKISGDIYRYNLEDISLLSKCKKIFEQYFKTEELNKILITNRDELIAERNGLILERDELTDKRNGLVIERDILVAERAELTTNYNSLLAEKNGLVNERDNLVVERNGLLNSRSWRITRPLRKLSAFIRRHKILHLFAKGLLSIKKHGIRITIKKIIAYRRQRFFSSPKKNISFELLYYGSSFTRMAQIINHPKSNLKGNVYREDILRKYDKKPKCKKVLLISHDLNLTGAPVAVYYFAKYLLDIGYCPVIVSPLDGNLTNTICNDKIPVIVLYSLFNSDFVKTCSNIFDLIIINTAVCAPAVSMLSETVIPVLWWFHESNASYSQHQVELVPKNLNKNVHIYCVGDYAKKALLAHFPHFYINTLLYYVPDYFNLNNLEQYKLNKCDGKIIFCCIGTLDERKGQDILADAIENLSKDYLEKVCFIFIGTIFSKAIYKKITSICKKYPDCVFHINEVSQKQIKSIYKQIDCLICSSRDDPMPIVVTEAFMNEKIVICSENTGSAGIITDGVDGFIYKNNNYTELAEKIEYVIDNINKLKQMGKNARKTYQNNFSKEVFESNITNIMKQMLPSKKYEYDVSVIIPAYNASDIFDKTLTSLLSQKNSGKIEIVIVDSGSTDNTVNICKNHGVNLIQIPNEDFTHSYARNLGAEKSNGKVLLFMTQDAMPSSSEWINKLISPVISGEYAAVSSGEICPENTDLYYRIISFYHFCIYLNLIKGDLTGCIENCKSNNDLRINASLNDVACAIRADVFNKFQYRFNYAEDLDLGLRLIKSGHKIKMLSNNKVIHGHNRTAGYYLRRAIVETIALEKILHNGEKITEDEKIIGKRIIHSYSIITEVINRIEKMNEEYESTEIFIKKVCDEFDKVLRKADKFTMPIYGIQCGDSIVERVVSKCVEEYSAFEHESSINHALEVNNFLKDIFNNYFIHNRTNFDYTLKHDICDCLYKRLAGNIGLDLPKMGNNCKIINIINELSKGV